MAQPARRLVIQRAAATVGAPSVAPHLLAQAAPVRVGYTMARSSAVREACLGAVAVPSQPAARQPVIA